MLQRIVTVQVPANRQVLVELPPEVPVGPAQLEIRVLGEHDDVVDFALPEIDVSKLPRFFDERTGEWKLVGRSGVVREVCPAE